MAIDIKKLAAGEEIWVNEFTEKSAQEFREEILEATKGTDPLRPVIVYIDSYGGMVDSLAKMIETMDEIPNPIITVCCGKAMSCGAMLLSHGDIRFAGKHSRVMVHEVSSGTIGNVHDMAADTQETKRLNKYFMGLLAKNCNIKGGYDALRRIIKNQDGRENYMDADAALKFGIVDGIGMPQVNKLNLYQVEATTGKKRLADRIDEKKPKAKSKKSETKR